MTPHQILERLGGERFLQRFIREVEAVANATEETGQNGKVTLTVKTFKPKEADRGDQYIGLETRIVPTWPAPKARRTGLYVDEGGLHVNPPNQVQMDLRTVEAAPTVREAGAAAPTVREA